MSIAQATLPTKFGIFQISIFKSKDNLEHAALIKGKNFDKEVLVRIHSQCLTGDTFSSLRCDCREQLQQSLKKISRARNGVLIYLNQEGRGIGLTNKIRAYALQENGLDTVTANEQLGFAADQRNYKIAAQILKKLNINQINLLTNNPDKVNQLRQLGVNIKKCLSLEIAPNKTNNTYLKTKKYKMNHKLNLV
ncbi:GTP cyclohydrolase II [Candidatus Daviesbacteria bacterium]|nr:GTP cyclohydrolase II [Candidatus Daviesbacteria bacterium]